MKRAHIDMDLELAAKKIEKLENEIKGYEHQFHLMSSSLKEKSDVESELARISKENYDLKESLEDAKRGSLFSQKITDMYKEKASVESLVEVRVQEEREKNEKKSAKVLEILKQKDSQIKALEENLKEHQQNISDLHEILVNTKSSLENFENQEKNLKNLQKTISEHIETIQDLKNQIEILKESDNLVSDLKKQVQSLSESLKKVQDENKKLKNREDGILSLTSRQESTKSTQEKILKEKDQMIVDLLSKVSSQSSYIESLISKFPNKSYQEILSTVLRLEEENRQLCGQLAENSGKYPSDFTNIFQNKEQLGYELSLKNKEIIELQNQIISLQKKSSSQDNDLVLTREQEKSCRLEIENDSLKKLISTLEQANKDLQNDINQIVCSGQGVGSETFTQNLAAQTQLVSRLNSRLLSLKDREEAALKQLAESEETIKQLKKLLEEKPKSSKSSTKSFKSQETQCEDPDSKSSPWESFEKARYEKKISDLDKELISYQNKYYEVLKALHQTKADIGLNEASQIQEISKQHKENIKLAKEIENLQEIRVSYEYKIKEYINTNQAIARQAKDLTRKIENDEQKFRNSLEELESSVSQYKLEIALKDSCIEERTAQVAVLLENLQGNSDDEDLAVKVSHFKAIEGSLNRQIIELKSSVNSLTQKLEIESKKNQISSKKEQELISKLQKLENSSQELIKNLEILKETQAFKENEIFLLQNQISRYQDSEKDYKSRIEIYLKQISTLKTKYTEDISRERQEFQDEIIRIREESEPFDYELQYDRPLVQAINQLTISLKDFENKSFAQDINALVDKTKDIVMVADKELFSSLKKTKELEFSLKKSVFFKHFDTDNLNLIEKLNETIFMLGEELKIWNNPKNLPNPEIYTNRIKLLEKELQERNKLITSIESDYIDTKKNLEILEKKLKKIQEKGKQDEINNRVQEKQLVTKLENDIRVKLKSRDEEIKGYLDSQLTKLVLNTPEANKILELAREISSLKLIINELEHKFLSESNKNDYLQKAYSELSEIIYESDNKDYSINITSHGPTLQLLEQKQHELHKIREAFETRKEENSFLQQKIAELKKELQALKGVKNDSQTREKLLIDEIKEIKEKHRREIINLKNTSQHQLQLRIQELELQYQELSAKYQDGQFPGDFKNQNKQLFMEIESLNNEKINLQAEIEGISRKYQNSSQTLEKVKEELEIYKNVVLDVGYLPESEKINQKNSKKLTFEKSKNNPTYRLIRALVSAKLAEAEACKNLKKSAETQLLLQKEAIISSESIKNLEFQLKSLEKYLKLQKVPLPQLETLEESPTDYMSRIQELEKENTELKLLQSKHWSEIKLISKTISPVEFPADEIGNIIEGVIYLSDLLADSDAKDSFSIENCQRLVIRTLNNAIKKLLKPTDGLGSLLEYKPSDKEDRQLWYVELLEGQTDSLGCIVKELIDFTNKVSVEVSGNLLTAGQYKGAAMDLAKTTKETSNQLDFIKSVCMLIKTDLLELKNKDETYSNDYKERAFLAEAMKRKLEEEILKIKMENSYKIAEIQEYAKSLEQQNSELKEFHEKNEIMEMNYQKDISRNKTISSKLELELKKTQESYFNLEKINTELNETKENLIKKLEKFQKDQKQKLVEVQEQINGKDKLVLELQKQNKILQEEKSKINQELISTKKNIKDLRKELDNSKDTKESEKEIRDMKIIIDDYKADIKRTTENHKKEIEQLISVIAELERNCKNIKNKYHKIKHYANSKSRNKEEDLDLLKHAYNAQVLNAKNESKEKIKELSSQIHNLQALLKEKISELDAESHRKTENIDEVRRTAQQELETQKKISILEEKLKTQGLVHDQEIKKLTQELQISKYEHEKLIVKLQENFTSAEVLTDFITKSEQEKKNLDLNLRLEIQSLQKKEKDKDAVIDQLKKKTNDLNEKIKELNKIQSQNNTVFKDNEELKIKINELNNNKAQLKGKIKELEGKIREYESLKESDEQKYAQKLESIQAEVHSSYEEYEKTIARYEGQLEGLKEQYNLELRRIKGAQKSAETVDSMFQIAKRDGLIKALRKELKLKSQKLEKKHSGPDNEEVLVLQNQVFKLKAIIKNLEHQLSIVKEEAQKLRAEIDMNIEINDQIREKDYYTRKEIISLEKKHKEEMQAVLQEYNKLLYRKN
jgi:chromosome segregation ATPase